MHERLGPATVIGEEDESGGIEIEATDQVEGVLFGIVNEVDDSGVFGIRRRTEDPDGFVQHEAEATSGGLDRGVV